VYFAAPCGQRWHISLVDNLFRAAVKVFPGEHLDFLSVQPKQEPLIISPIITFICKTARQWHGKDTVLLARRRG